ncbi:unnamed protein product [Trifolium pratense]|uniref:Uncharacterized protein n=1 Tax=Trifolium pratense TaxID=57577 RepID=A0ACB0IMC9_TRIPR|nr:unnamed protein product [Trifolium pratense]
MNQIVSPEGSDSIRGSDNAVQEADEHLICSSASNLEGIELKVGLPGTRRGQHVVSQVGQSGVRDLCSVASEANIVMPSQGREGDYREVVEAVRLMGLQQELGVRFHGSDEEDLQRAIDVEIRDRKEKEDWEQQRWMGFILKERFKGLKVTIKQWNQQVLGDSEEIKRKLILEIMTLDQKSEVTGLSQQEVAVRKNKFDDLLCILKSIDAAIFQRSRSKWLKAGDANTAYFHSRVKMRRRRNGMVALLTLTG